MMIFWWMNNSQTSYLARRGSGYLLLKLLDVLFITFSCGIPRPEPNFSLDYKWFYGLQSSTFKVKSDSFFITVSPSVIKSDKGLDAYYVSISLFQIVLVDLEVRILCRWHYNSLWITWLVILLLSLLVNFFIHM